MNLCEKWPGKKDLKDYLEGVFAEEDIDLEDNINYKQWIKTN